MDHNRIQKRVQKTLSSKFEDEAFEVITEKYNEFGMKATVIVPAMKGRTVSLAYGILPRPVHKEKDAVNGLVGQIIPKLRQAGWE